MTGIHVLHVDDERDFAELVAAYLERENDDFVVHTATSVDAACDALAERDVDCVVSDYEMPECDGVEFLATVRDEYPDLPFVLYTGKGSEEVASEAISAGVTGYLQKEAGTSQYALLANRVRNAVRSRRARRERERSVRRFEAVFEDPGMLVGILSPAGRVQRTNRTSLEFVEADEDAVLGERFWETPWWPAERRGDVREWVERAASGEYVTYDAALTDANGDPYRVDGTIRPVTDDAGDVVSLVVSARATDRE